MSVALPVRHGVKLECGLSTGDRVLVTSRKLCLSGMPGVVTGQARDIVRVRVTSPWSVNVVFTVWAKAGELKKVRKK